MVEDNSFIDGGGCLFVWKQVTIFTFCSGLLQTASINKGAENSKNDGKFFSQLTRILFFCVQIR